MQVFDHFGDVYWLAPASAEPPEGWGPSEEVSGWYVGTLLVDRCEASLLAASRLGAAFDLDDERAMTEWIGAQLDARNLRIWRRVRPPAASHEKPTPVEATPLLSELYVVELSWIAWEIVDAHGQPMSGIAYELDTPDGEVRTGVTDAQGRVRESGIAKGTCAIRFTSTAA